MTKYEISVQVVAEQRNSNGLYIHIDTEYFSDSTSMSNWISEVVEWADRFRIYKVGQCEKFFEGLVVDHKVPRWEKLNIEDHKVVDIYS